MIIGIGLVIISVFAVGFRLGHRWSNAREEKIEVVPPLMPPAPPRAVRREPTAPLVRDNIQQEAQAMRMLSRAMYRELKQRGYGEREFVALATELVQQAHAELSEQKMASSGGRKV